MATIGTQAFCATCPYWDATSTAGDGGYCRRMPPTAAVGASKLQPFTAATDWCGEHPGRRGGEVKIAAAGDVIEATDTRPGAVTPIERPRRQRQAGA